MLYNWLVYFGIVWYLIGVISGWYFFYKMNPKMTLKDFLVIFTLCGLEGFIFTIVGAIIYDFHKQNKKNITPDEFNKKFSKNLKPGCPGMMIEDPLVIKYLYLEFLQESESNDNFEFSKIEISSSKVVIYSNSFKNDKWQKEINKTISSF